MDNAALLGIDTSVDRPIKEWVGFKPVQPTLLRMEIDDKLSSQSKLRIVHCYGLMDTEVVVGLHMLDARKKMQDFSALD